MTSRFFRRSLSIRSTLLARRFNRSTFTYISHYDDCEKREDSHPSAPKIQAFVAQRRSLGCYLNNTFCRTPYGQFGNGISFRREMSTDANEALASICEVAAAAADSAFPVSTVQYLIGGVHSVTGLNWWASIAITTLLVHAAVIPFHIWVIRKQNSKCTVILSQCAKISQQVKATGNDPQAVAAGNKKIKDILGRGIGFHQHLRLLGQIPIVVSFLLAVPNMARKVPSFRTGGTLWFTDLSAPDAMCILPISLALITLIHLESFMRIPGGNPLVTNMMKWGFALVWIPITASSPTAVLCFWFTRFMYKLCFEYVTRIPRVQKALGRQSIAEIIANLDRQVKKRN